MMEKEKSPGPNISRGGVSLKELVPYAIKRHEGNPGPPISERILWLSETIETEPFWEQLNHHIAKDKKKRQSVGGIFSRGYGDKQPDRYSWKTIFSSLDFFLKEFDMRATEFLFRDFQPQNPDTNLARIIDATREFSIEKYPRLRRLYWDDYQKAFESTAFWHRLAFDLTNVKKPVSTTTFFTSPKLGPTEQLESRRRQLEMKTTLRQPLWTIHGSVGKKVRFIEYGNLAQIARGLLNQDPRTFLLNYQQKSNDRFLEMKIKETKALLERKILPVKPKTEAMIKLTKKEFNKLINSKDFWLSLFSDITNHFNSQKPTYFLSFFLRHYDRSKNEINPGKLGTYARFMTIYMHEFKDLRKRLIKPSKKMVQYLMWNFAPSEEISSMVTQVKGLCAEFFFQDCLYVALQTPKFWKGFEKDISLMQGSHTLASFLRYFNEKNPNCDRKLHHKGGSKYQFLFHRAYHKKKDFIKFLSSIGINEVSDHKDGLARLFLYTAPIQMRGTLLEKFPKDFRPELKIRQIRSTTILNEAKNVINNLKQHSTTQTIHFDDEEKALYFREKLWIASRSLHTNITTELKDNVLTIKIGKRIKFPTKSRAEFEKKVKKFKLEGLTNKGIAEALGVEEVKDHHIEYAVRKLVGRGELKSRK